MAIFHNIKLEVQALKSAWKYIVSLGSKMVPFFAASTIIMIVGFVLYVKNQDKIEQLNNRLNGKEIESVNNNINTLRCEFIDFSDSVFHKLDKQQEQLQLLKIENLSNKRQLKYYIRNDNEKTKQEIIKEMETREREFWELIDISKQEPITDYKIGIEKWGKNK
jgi:hypothetical protein